MVRNAVAFGFGIWAERNVDINLIFIGFLVFSGAFFVAAVRSRSFFGRMPHVSGVLLALLWFSAGLLRMGCAQQLAEGAIAGYAGQTVSVHGIIAETPTVTAGNPGEWKVRYSVDLDWILAGENGKTAFPIKSGVFLTALQQTPLTHGVAGDALTATGKVHLFHAYRNPGQPDFLAILAERGIEARISVLPGTMKVSESESFFAKLERWRVQVRGALLAAMPDKDAALLTGMLFGGYDGIERQTVQDFSSTGIVHILSVSGAHIALVAAAVFWFARRLSAPEKWGALVAAGVMILYGIVSGFSPPVIRSVIMGLTGMAAIASGLLSHAPRALSLAILGMLAWEPRNAFDISFQLSVGCTAGLLYIYPRLAQWFTGVLPVCIITSTAATLAAQLAVLPLLFWYFGMIPLISLVANIIVVPLLEAVILLGLAGIILTGGFPAVAHFLFIAVSLLTGAAVEVNKVLAGIPAGNIALPAMGTGFGLIYYSFAVWLFGVPGNAAYSPAVVFRRRPLKMAAIGVVAAGMLLYGALVPGPLSVHFIDVGQGDSTLIITPHRRAILVDAGGAMGPGSNSFDVGERVVVPYLRHYGIKRIDLMILTHNHQDHAGGAAAVAKMVGARQVLLHPEEKTSQAVMRLQQAMQGKGMKSPEGMAAFEIDGVKMQLFQIGEAQEQVDGKKTRAGSSAENARSTVVRIEYGRHSFLLTGDMEGESEKRIMELNMPTSTVLKVGHHGSKLSCRPEFLFSVAPQYAVISVGAGNSFGHPAPETLRRLVEWPLTVYRTDVDGAVVFRSDGKKMHMEKNVD